MSDALFARVTIHGDEPSHWRLLGEGVGVFHLPELTERQLLLIGTGRAGLMVEVTLGSPDDRCPNCGAPRGKSMLCRYCGLGKGKR